jgi:ABC-type bacteriocin/lantibiotic exporter with double-glycine peptidase domain
VLRLAQMWQDSQQVRISAERLGDILNNPAEPAHALDKASPEFWGHNTEFHQGVDPGASRREGGLEFSIVSP